MASRVGLPGSGGTGDIDGSVFAAASVNKLPGGLVGYLDLTGAGAVTITSLADIGSLTWTANTSRTYLFDCIVAAQSTVAGDIIRITITDGSNTEQKRLEQGVPYAATNVVFPIKFLYQPSAGSVTLKVRGQRVSGTGVATTAAQGYLFARDEALSF